MIKGFSLKSKERRTVTTDASGQPAVGSTNVALIRIQKDISDIQLPPNINLSFPNPDDLLNFEVKIRPKEGFYQNGEFNFVFKIKQMYPYEPPKVQCKQKVRIKTFFSLRADFPSQHRPYRKCMPQYSPRRLETGTFVECSHIWTAIFVPGAQHRRPVEQGGCRIAGKRCHNVSAHRFSYHERKPI